MYQPSLCLVNLLKIAIYYYLIYCRLRELKRVKKGKKKNEKKEKKQIQYHKMFLEL